MAKSKEYQMAIKIAGQVEQSFKNSMGLTERELRNIAKQAAASSNAARNSLGNGFKDADKVVDSFSSGAKKALSAVAKAATVTATAVGGIAAAATKVGSDFEAQMSTVEAISGATASDMDNLNAKAKELGETTAFSATEAGQAMEYMAMAGWKTEDMLNGIDGVMSLAAASGEELGTVSDIVTDAMTAFGMSADEAGKFSDVLAKASSNANTNVSMMGETFQYVAPIAGSLGYDIEEVATAIGLMANSGIKASNAGTSLRSWMSRMASPTKQVKEAMDKLGISLTDEKGNMYSFQEIMQKTRKAFDGLTKAEKSQYASAIAGKSGMSGMLAVVNASEKDFKKLTKEIENASGAAEEMAGIKMDNLKGDTTLFKSASEGLGIEIYEQMDDGLRDIVQSITSEVGDVTEYLRENRFIEEFANDVKESIPTIVRNLKDAGESIAEFAEPFISVAEWMLEHPEVIESTLAGIATTIVSLKVASKVYDIASSFGTLAGVLTNPFALAILAVGAALGGAAGISMYIKKCETAAKNQNLAEHFGDISMSMEELRDVANRILDDGSITKLNDTLDEFDKVDNIAKGIKDTVRELDKYNWKVSLGLKLTKDEKQAYKEDITSYIEETQNMVENQRYAISLGVELFTGEDSDVGKIMDSFFAGEQEELAKLGKKLQRTVNKAFDDGLLTVDEEKKIQEIQKQMADISEGLTESKFNAGMEVIEAKYAGKELTADTAKNLVNEVQEMKNEALEGYEETLQEDIGQLNCQLSKGGISKIDYDNGVKELQEGYRKKIAELEAAAAEVPLEILSSAYGKEISGAGDNLNKIMSEYMVNDVDYWNEANANDYVNAISNETMESSTRNAIGDFVKELDDLGNQMEETANQIEANGGKVPDELENSLNRIRELQAYTGDEDSIWKVTAERMLNDDDYIAMLEKVQEAGGYIPEEIETAIASKAPEAASESAKTMYNAEGNALNTQFSTPLNVGVKVDTNNSATTASLNSNASALRNNMQNILNEKFSSAFNVAMKIKNSIQSSADSNIAHNAKGSIITQPTLSWFAEDGPEAAIPLDGSQRAKSLWVEAGQILGMYQNGTEKNSMMYQAEQMMNRDSSTTMASKSLKMLDRTEDNSTSNTITYAPTITITGNASRKDIEEASRTSQEEFEEMMERYLRNKKRISFT